MINTTTSFHLGFYLSNGLLEKVLIELDVETSFFQADVFALLKRASADVGGWAHRWIRQIGKNGALEMQRNSTFAARNGDGLALMARCLAHRLTVQIQTLKMGGKDFGKACNVNIISLWFTALCIDEIYVLPDWLRRGFGTLGREEVEGTGELQISLSIAGRTAAGEGQLIDKFSCWYMEDLFHSGTWSIFCANTISLSNSITRSVLVSSSNSYCLCWMIQ